MRKQLKNLGIIASLLALPMFSIISCENQKIVTTADNAQTSLDYEGIYYGTLPCANCEGIKTTIYINGDNTYKMVSVYSGKNDVQKVTGTFSWNKMGNTIQLKSNKNSEVTQFFVGENTLTKLDQQGNKITGNLAANYVLSKENYALLNKKWRPIELMGKPVVLDGKNTKEPYLLFDNETSRYQAVTDCNGIGGEFEIQPFNRIKLSPGFSTMMACDNMEIEHQLSEVLKQADGFIINGDELTLIKGRMAPLAKFKVPMHQ